MSAATRRKGLDAEREVANIWRSAGLEVRNLEGTGDHLVLSPIRTGAHAVPIHSEVKRQERLKLPEWLRQAAEEAPSGAIAVVSFRQNRGEWYSCLPTVDLAELVAR